MKKKRSLSVFGITVSPLLQNNCGVDTKIGPADYQHNSKNQPSRQVRLIHDSENIHVGTVDEVPKRQGNATVPPPALRQTDAGRMRNDETQGGYNYKSMRDDFLVEWDDRKKELWLNEDHRFIKRYFLPDEFFVLNSPKHRKVVELYEAWLAIATSLDQLYDKTEPEPQKHDDSWEDDYLNYSLNHIINAQIQSDPLMMDHIEGIDKKIK